MTLEGLLPQCPIHKEIEDKNLTTCDLIVYGIKSNDCVKCPGKDSTCHLYKSWYHDYQQKLELNRGKEDGQRQP